MGKDMEGHIEEARQVYMRAQARNAREMRMRRKRLEQLKRDLICSSIKFIKWLAKATLTFSTAALIYYEVTTTGTISGLSLTPSLLGLIWWLTIAMAKEASKKDD